MLRGVLAVVSQRITPYRIVLNRQRSAVPLSSPTYRHGEGGRYGTHSI